jgi:hypothetical protein
MAGKFVFRCFGNFACHIARILIDVALRANDVETQTAREFRLGGVEGLHRLCL